MSEVDETYICERCERTVNPLTSTCGDITCPLFDPRYKEDFDESVREQGRVPEVWEW